jgi:YD repeat-containing protein
MRTDREKHGLIGPVKSVRVETATFERQGEKLTEQPSFSHTMRFNQGGWLTEQVKRNPDGPEWRTANDYSDSGRLLTMMGMETSRQTFAYDAAGKKSEEVSYNQDGTLGSKAVFEREYDEHGNWTNELVSTASTWDAEFGLSIPVHVSRRIITYW